VSDTINAILMNKALITQLKENCKDATQILNWENEEKVIQKVYSIFI
jgi:hypothetical protein